MIIRPKRFSQIKTKQEPGEEGLKNRQQNGNKKEFIRKYFSNDANAGDNILGVMFKTYAKTGEG